MFKDKRRKIEEDFLEQLGKGFPEGLIKQRIQYLFKWYNYKAEHYRFLFYASIFLGLFFPALVTLLSSGIVGEKGLFLKILKVSDIQKITALLGVIMTAVMGYFSWLKLDEQWIRARVTIEELKSETVKYMAKTKDIDIEKKADYEVEFIEIIENIVEQETVGWKTLQFKKRKEGGSEK